MSDDEVDDVLRERMKAALWFAVGKMVDEECLKQEINATPQFIGALTEMVWTQIENSAQDLESFAKHAGRRTVTTDDVLLLTRRNDGLKDLMEAYVQKQKAQKTKKSARRGG